MNRRAPPLNALRAFEAAARHLSFTRAAAELHVTQAAVSHQVKALESYLGVKLFRRLNRAILLTAAGKNYLPAVQTAFDTITLATRRVQEQETGGPLRVSVLPSFASKWLLPRLAGFRERYPRIDVLISARSDLVDFGRDDMDVALRYGGGHYPGLVVDYLMGDEVFPVCSPSLLEAGPRLAKPADLAHHTLLHSESSPDSLRFEEWSWWLEAAGVAEIAEIDAGRGPGFNDSALMIQAAVQGQGVALGRRTLCADDLAAGRLVKLFGLTLQTRESYYLVAPIATAEQPKVAAFRG